jgi:hypothetical protein
MTAEELSQNAGISVILAKERLALTDCTRSCKSSYHMITTMIMMARTSCKNITRDFTKYLKERFYIATVIIL